MDLKNLALYGLATYGGLKLFSWATSPAESQAAPAPAPVPASTSVVVEEERVRGGFRKRVDKVFEAVEDLFDGPDEVQTDDVQQSYPSVKDGTAAGITIGALRRPGRLGRGAGAPGPRGAAAPAAPRPFSGPRGAFGPGPRGASAPSPFRPSVAPVMPPRALTPSPRPMPRPYPVPVMPMPVPYPMPVMPVAPLDYYAGYEDEGDYDGDPSSAPSVAAANQYSYKMSGSSSVRGGQVELLGNGTVAVVTFDPSAEKTIRSKHAHATGAAKQNGDQGAAIVKRPGAIGVAFTSNFDRAEDLLAEDGWEELFPTHLWKGGPV